MKQKIIIDAANAALGRLASYAAKQSLLGKEVIIVNCSKAIISGKNSTTIKSYQEKRAKGGSSQHGPFFPKSPERLMKRTIRGMLSYKQARGKEALKRIMCYSDTPQEYAQAKKITAGKEKRTSTIQLQELSKRI